MHASCNHQVLHLLHKSQLERTRVFLKTKLFGGNSHQHSEKFTHASEQVSLGQPPYHLQCTRIPEYWTQSIQVLVPTWVRSSLLLPHLWKGVSGWNLPRDQCLHYFGWLQRQRPQPRRDGNASWKGVGIFYIYLPASKSKYISNCWTFHDAISMLETTVPLNGGTLKNTYCGGSSHKALRRETFAQRQWK